MSASADDATTLEQDAAFDRPLRRVAYEAGMLLGLEATRDEQDCHRRRLNRHQYWLHGAGTIAGMLVKLDPAQSADPDQDMRVRVLVGLGVDGLGREILAHEPYCLNLRDWLAAQSETRLREGYQEVEQCLWLRVSVRYQDCLDLGDRAVIAQLNEGRYRRFNRGLYAVVVSYAEIGSDIAEVFPQGLGARRTVQYDVIAEAVQLRLVPLPQPLPQGSGLAVRATLVRALLGGGQASGVLPEDGVALGVLAIRDDRPEWLDAELLRQPLRSRLLPGDLQGNLLRHYRLLLDEVLDYRRAGSLGGDFAAAEYVCLA